MLKSDLDATGFSKLMQTEEKRRFFSLNEKDKIVYPETSMEY